MPATRTLQERSRPLTEDELADVPWLAHLGPAELDRVLKITEGVMRSMIICKDE